MAVKTSFYFLLLGFSYQVFFNNYITKKKKRKKDTLNSNTLLKMKSTSVAFVSAKITFNNHEIYFHKMTLLFFPRKRSNKDNTGQYLNFNHYIIYIRDTKAILKELV